MKNNVFSMKKIKEFTLENGYPLSVHWAITESCNLRCTHCYMDKKPQFVPLEIALEIIRFLKKNGFLIVTLSGGECTTHPNFKEIYKALKDSGMIVNIFTNGTAFNEDILQLLGQYKPNKVEISIYGKDEENFYMTTGVKDAFKYFKKNVKALKELGIRVLLKAPITKKNFQYLNDFIDISKENNTEYKFGTFVFPMLTGDKITLKERLEPKEIVNIEFDDENNLDMFRKLVKDKGFNKVNFNSKCSSCMNNFVLNSDCSFSFCGMMIEPKFSFNDYKTIETAYNDVISYRKKVQKLYEAGPCSKCENVAYCPGCPAHLMLENGNTNTCNEYFKEVTQLKLSRV